MDYATLSPEELLVACLRGGEESAWVEFVRRFQPLIARVALRVARQWGHASATIVDDLVQETYLKLCADRCRLLQNFQPAHKDAAYGYVKVFTANLTHDHFKASSAKKRGGTSTTGPLDAEARNDGPPEPESPHFIAERLLLVGQVAAFLKGAVCGSHGERDRRIFWLYYRAGLAASEIARLPTIGLTTKGVESTILRLTRIVRNELIPASRPEPQASEPIEGKRPAESL